MPRPLRNEWRDKKAKTAGAKAKPSAKQADKQADKPAEVMSAEVMSAEAPASAEN
jgi:hypothetical protein